jgi:hypothetical protein
MVITAELSGADCQDVLVLVSNSLIILIAFFSGKWI